MLFNQLLHSQDITYWAPLGISIGGGRTFSAPVTIKGRWEDRQDVFHTIEGQEAVSQAQVWLNQDVELGGYLYLGTSVAADPTEVSGASEIRRFMKIPDLRNFDQERRAIL